MKRSQYFLAFTLILSCLLVPAVGYCSVQSTLMAVQDRLINEIMPLAGIIGLCFAAFSFFTGNPNARGHLWLAIIGACVGFGAPEIISFIHGLVH